MLPSWAAQSFVRVRFRHPGVFHGHHRYTERTTCSRRFANAAPRAASTSPRSSEMFGLVQAMPQTERTPFIRAQPLRRRRRSPVLLDLTGNYRESYGIHASERNSLQPRIAAPRVREFVTRKVTAGLAPSTPGCRARIVGSATSRPARLGLCAGIRRGDVAHAPAGSRPTITWWRRAKRTRCRSSSRWPSRARSWTTRNS